MMFWDGTGVCLFAKRFDAVRETFWLDCLSQRMTVKPESELTTVLTGRSV